VNGNFPAAVENLTFLDKDNGDDHTIDSQDTSHDNGNQRFHDNGRLPDTNAADT